MRGQITGNVKNSVVMDTSTSDLMTSQQAIMSARSVMPVVKHALVRGMTNVQAVKQIYTNKVLPASLPVKKGKCLL